MTYDQIFTAYYTLYRAEAVIPPNTDDEYKIGLPLANEAINRWSNYDNTFWKELFTTRVLSDDGDDVIVTGQTDYEAPADMQLAGGFVKILDSSNNTVERYPVVEPQDAQFKNDSARYAFFIGDPNNGYILRLNPAPPSTLNGKTIDYVYYKKPTLFTTGGDITEMSEPYFIVHRILASRFRSSRNPYYGSAKTDAEDVLRTMQLTNNSGNWADPGTIADNSAEQWGL